MSGSNPRFPLFDSLRAIAALMVVACHLSVVRPVPLDEGWRPYLINMNTGVAVFFLISGFLLYRPFVSARYDGRPAPATLLYAQRRILRIVPAYWVALVGVVLLLGSSGEGIGASPVFTTEGVVRYFGFLQIYDSDTLLGGISAAWTLCVEMTFYAFLPLWALLMQRLPYRSRQGFVRSELVGLAVLFLIGLVWTAIAAGNANFTAATFFDVTEVEPWLYLPPGFLDHFALGMLLAVLSVVTVQRRSARAVVGLVERFPWLPWAVGVGAFVLLVNLPRLLPSDRVAVTVAVHELQAVVALGLLLPAVFGDPDRRFRPPSAVQPAPALGGPRLVRALPLARRGEHQAGRVGSARRARARPLRRRGLGRIAGGGCGELLPDRAPRAAPQPPTVTSPEVAGRRCADERSGPA